MVGNIGGYLGTFPQNGEPAENQIRDLNCVDISFRVRVIAVSKARLARQCKMFSLPWA